MKSNWQTLKLRDILKFEYGKPLPRSERTDNGNYAVYGANGVKARSHRFLISTPSIVVGRKGSAGKLKLVNEPFWPLDVTYYVTHDAKQFDLKFIYLLLLLQDIPKLAKGVKPGINRNDVYAINVAIPPLPEQHRIVKILDDVFERIGKATEQTEKNLQNAKELFESYLNGVFKNPGDDWEMRALQEIAEEFGRGKSRHRPRNDKSLYGGNYPFIQTGDIRNSVHYINEYSQTYNEKGLAQSKLWPKSTLCITIAANIAETGILTFDACFPDSVIGFVADPAISDVNFIEYLLQFFKTNLKELGKGSAQDNINLGTFKDVQFPLPPLPQQQQLVGQLDALSKQTGKLKIDYQKRLDNLEELKKSVLTKSFKGEL